MGMARDQIFAEEINIEVHHGLVKVEIESRAGEIDLLVPFDVFFRAERRARAIVAEIAETSRTRIVPVCAVCKTGKPPG